MPAPATHLHCPPRQDSSASLQRTEAAHVKDLLAVLRFVENPCDRISGFRIIQLVPGVGPGSAQRVLDYVITAADPLGVLANPPRPPQAGEHWTSFLEMVAGLRAGRAGWPAELGLARGWYEPRPRVSSSHLTPRWREPDSNYRLPVAKTLSEGPAIIGEEPGRSNTGTKEWICGEWGEHARRSPFHHQFNA